MLMITMMVASDGVTSGGTNFINFSEN